MAQGLWSEESEDSRILQFIGRSGISRVAGEYPNFLRVGLETCWLTQFLLVSLRDASTRCSFHLFRSPFAVWFRWPLGT